MRLRYFILEGTLMSEVVELDKLNQSILRCNLLLIGEVSALPEFPQVVLIGIDRSSQLLFSFARAHLESFLGQRLSKR